MNQADSTTITGTIKNIKVYTNTRGTLLKGWFDKREVSTLPDGTPDRSKYVFGTNIITTDPEVIATLMQLDKARVNTEFTPKLTLTGSLSTWFDNRPEAKAKGGVVSQQQLVVESVSVA